MNFFLMLLELVRLLVEQFKSGKIGIEEVRAKSRILERAKAAHDAGLTDDDVLYLSRLVKGKEQSIGTAAPTATMPRAVDTEESTDEKKSSKTKKK